MKKEKYNILIVGATGNVGREIITILCERNFPIDNIKAVASSSSLGKEISFGPSKIIKCDTLENINFSDYDFAFFAAGSSVSEIYAPIAAKNKCIVIDKSSFFRMHKNVPLIIPEVNGQLIDEHQNIIASPNCSVIPLAMSLKPLQDKVIIKRVVVTTLQSVSGAGKKAMDELFNQTKGMFTYQEKENVIFPKRISFNVIPQIDKFSSFGQTKEEQKLEKETQKILEDELPITSTCIRVPVFIGHSASVNVEFENELSIEEATKLFKNAPGIRFIDQKSSMMYATPIDSVHEDDVFISRLRPDSTVKYGLSMWVVSNNLRKGAALNAVQIAELLIKNGKKL